MQSNLSNIKINSVLNGTNDLGKLSFENDLDQSLTNGFTSSSASSDERTAPNHEFNLSQLLSEIAQQPGNQIENNQIFTSHINQNQEINGKEDFTFGNVPGGNLLTQAAGWLNNNSQKHQVSSDVIRCGCPLCSGNTLTNASTKTNTSNGLSPANAIISSTGNTTTDAQINGIASGYNWKFSWGTRQITYSFYEDTVFNGTYSGSETGVKEVSEGVKTNVRNILAKIQTLINVDFVEVAETNTSTFGRMRFMLSNAPSYAYAYYPSSDSVTSIAGDVHLNPSYDRLGDTNGFQNVAGNHGYMSIIHEIGHTLGLKHPQDDSPNLAPADNNTTNTVMTYNFTGNSAGTFMPYDIQALQYVYGARANNASDTTYQFTSRTDNFSVNGQLSLNTTNATKQTIWDSAGVDTLDFSQLAANATGYRFDLNPGGILTAKSAYNATSYSGGATTTYGTAIAYNVLLENLVNSGSNDDIYLNNAANTIKGYSSTRVTKQDVIWNATNQDTLDLSGYSASAVTSTQSGNDLVLGLGANGSVTVKNYYAGNSISLAFAVNNSIPNITLALSPGRVNEDGATNLLYAFTRTGNLTTALSVNYSVGGTATFNSDYTQSGAANFNTTTGTITFAANSATAILTIDPTADTTIEADETVALTLALGTGYTVGTSTAIQGTITNDDYTTLETFGATALVKDAANNLYAKTGNNSPINIKYNAQSIYQGYFSGWETLAAEIVNGEKQVLWKNISGNYLHLWHLDDNWNWKSSEGQWAFNSPEALTQESNFQMDLNGDGIVGNSTSPAITLAVSPSSVSEDGATNLLYTFTRTGNLTNSLIVNYSVGGTATFKSDYTQSGAANFNTTTGTITFAANSSTAILTIDPTADTTVEADETVALTLALGTGYTVGTTTAIQGTITNDDYTTLETFGATALVKDAANNLYAKTGNNSPINVKYNGQSLYQGKFSGWETLAAEIVNGEKQVLWKNTSGNYLHLWHLDNSWNWKSSEGQWAFNSPEALTQESNFQMDLNGDGRYRVGQVDFLTGLPNGNNSSLKTYNLNYINGPLSTQTGSADYGVLQNWQNGDQIILTQSATDYALGNITNLNGIGGPGIYKDLNHNGLVDTSDDLVGLVNNVTGLALNNTAQFQFV